MANRSIVEVEFDQDRFIADLTRELALSPQREPIEAVAERLLERNADRYVFTGPYGILGSEILE